METQEENIKDSESDFKQKDKDHMHQKSVVVENQNRAV